MAAGMAGRHKHRHAEPRATVRHLYRLPRGSSPDGMYRTAERKDAAKGFPTGGKGRKGKGRRHQTAAKGVVQRFLRPRAGQPLLGAQPHTAGRHRVGRERDALRGRGNCTAQACMPRIRGYYARTRRRLAHGHTIPRRGFIPVVRGGGKAQRFGAAPQMRALLHKQEKHAGVLGHVRRDIRRTHARGTYQYHRRGRTPTH